MTHGSTDDGDTMHGGRNDHIAGAAALIAGAAGFGLGLLVSAGRKAAAQAPTFAAGDWFEGLKAEHQQARTLFEALAATGEDDTGTRAALLGKVQHALARHNVQEEYVVYCVLAEHGHAEVAEALHADHFELKQGLFELEMMGTEKRPGFTEKLAHIRTAFESHVREEEDQSFPALQALLSEAQGQALTSRMNRAGYYAA